MLRNRGGMTLMEVLVTMVIAGLITLSGTVAFSQIVDHQARIGSASEATERAAALHELLHSWLYSGTVTIPTAAQTRGRSGTGTITAADGLVSVNPAVVSGNELRFTTIALTPTNSAQTTMRLFVDDDLNTPEQGLTLEYQVSAQTHLMRVQLDTTITLLTTEYRNTRTMQWVPGEQAQGITANAVRVTLFSSDSLNASPLISVPLILPMGANATATPPTTPPAGGGG